jgi:hypothetical protein
VVTVAFHDPAGRPLAGAVISIAAAPGEVNDIAMITDERGEINVTPSGFGDYEFVVFSAGAAHSVVAQILEGVETLAVEVR